MKIAGKQVYNVRRVTGTVSLGGSEHVYADTAFGVVEVNLPDPAVSGDVVRVYPASATSSGATATIYSLGPPIDGVAAPFVFSDASYRFVDFICVAGEWITVRVKAGANAVVVSDTAPASPAIGDLWFDSLNAVMFVWYDDGTDSDWIDVSGFSGGGTVKSVNGIGPDGLGNVAVALTSVTTGVLSARPLVANQGDVYVVSGDPTPANNGITFIRTSTGTWAEIGSAGLAANDARYVNVTGDTMTGDLFIGATPTYTLISQNQIDLRNGVGPTATRTFLNSEIVYVRDLTEGTTEVHAGSIHIFDAAGNPGLVNAPQHATTKQYVDQQDALKVSKAGDTMTGALVLHADPTLNLQAATKQYVDSRVPTVVQNIWDGITTVAPKHAWGVTRLVANLGSAGNVVMSGHGVNSPNFPWDVGTYNSAVQATIGSQTSPTWLGVKSFADQIGGRHLYANDVSLIAVNGQFPAMKMGRYYAPIFSADSASRFMQDSSAGHNTLLQAADRFGNGVVTSVDGLAAIVTFGNANAGAASSDQAGRRLFSVYDFVANGTNSSNATTGFTIARDPTAGRINMLHNGSYRFTGMPYNTAAGLLNVVAIRWVGNQLTMIVNGTVQTVTLATSGGTFRYSNILMGGDFQTTNAAMFGGHIGHAMLWHWHIPSIAELQTLSTTMLANL